MAKAMIQVFMRRLKYLAIKSKIGQNHFIL